MRQDDLGPLLKRPTAPIVCSLVDLLWTDGPDLTNKTILQRRAKLNEIMTPVGGIQVGGYIEKCEVDLLRLTKGEGYRGNHCKM
jgi:ATP-dependent DNA ligase